ncbi:unnamed protein product [Ilex paraguariensis]|uniref:Uncharacterized protein n=1 Tax=Ilex paraguariensis TaxID=185542 RepID=A0ABC8SAZ5_9AQUA
MDVVAENFFNICSNTGGEKSTVKPQAPIKLEAFILFLSDHRERAKQDYEQLKKTVDELRASERVDVDYNFRFRFPDAFKSDDAPSSGYYWVAPLPLLPFVSWFISAELPPPSWGLSSGMLLGMFLLFLPALSCPACCCLPRLVPTDCSAGHFVVQLDPQLVFSRFSSSGLLMGPPPSMKISSPLSSCLAGLKPFLAWSPFVACWVWKHVVELYNICHSKMEEIVPKGVTVNCVVMRGFNDDEICDFVDPTVGVIIETNDEKIVEKVVLCHWMDG